MGAHLDDVLEGFLGLVLEVLGGLGKHIHGKKTGRNVSFSKELGVIGRVSSDLTKGPGGSSLEVILRLVDEGILKRSDSFGDDDGHGEGVVEGRDISESHDSGKSSVTLGFTDVVNSSGSTTRVNNELGELGGLLGNFSNASSSVLSNLNIHVLEAVENSWEDLSLNDYLSKIDGVLSNLSEALTDVSFKLGIGVGDEGSKIWDCTLVDNGLGELLGVLSNFSKSGG